MALIECPECNTQVSSAAPSCPKCGFPVAQQVKHGLGKGRFDEAAHESGVDLSELEGPRPLPPLSEGESKSELRKQTNKRDWRLLAAVVILLLVAAAIINRCERDAVEPVATVEPGSQSRGWVQGGSRPSSKAVTVQQKKPKNAHEVPREDSRAWCRDVVHGLAPKLRKVLGVSTVAVQVSLSSTMSCKGTPEGFSCVYTSGAPLELRVSDRDKVRGFRLMFTEEPVQGFAAPGCCDGVAEAAEMYRRAKFQRYGRDCALTFGRFPSSWQWADACQGQPLHPLVGASLHKLQTHGYGVVARRWGNMATKQAARKARSTKKRSSLPKKVSKTPKKKTRVPTKKKAAGPPPKPKRQKPDIGKSFKPDKPKPKPKKTKKTAARKKR
jgi:hypothetical protein